MRTIFIICGLLMMATSVAAQGWPLLDYLGRWPRQVVQPTWLTDGAADKDTKPVTPVRTDEKSLQEAAEIRKSIQKAIDDDQFAVDTGIKDKGVETPPLTPSNSGRMIKWFNGFEWQWPWPTLSSTLSGSAAAQNDFWQHTLKRWQSVFRMPTRTING